MHKETAILFGQKEEFAIEIKPYKIPQKFYLRLWIKSKAIGDYKRGGSLDYLINEFFKFAASYKNLYEEDFISLSDFQIFNELVSYIEKGYSIEEEEKLFLRMERYSFNIADCQLNEFTILRLYLSSEKIIKFLIYEMDGKTEPEFYSFDIAENIFFKTYKSFMMYAFKNRLKKNGLFFPDNFSVEDIQ